METRVGYTLHVGLVVQIFALSANLAISGSKMCLILFKE